MSTQMQVVPDAVERLSWGGRFCLLYDRPADLAEFLAPFFRAGIEAGQACLWVAAEPVPLRAAEAALRGSFPDLDRLAAAGLVEIVDATRHPDGALDGLIADREARALRAGHGGLRLAAPARPAQGTGAGDRRVLALYSHCTAGGGAASMLDAVAGHQLALARGAGGWSILERPGLPPAAAPPQEAAMRDEELERRVAERTRHLKRALAGRAMRLNEIRHRINNDLQVVSSLLRLKRRQIGQEEVRLAFDEVIERVHAISVARDEPFDIGDLRPFDAREYLTWLCRLLVEAQGAEGRVEVEVAVAGRAVPIDLDTAIPIGLLVNELIGNACRRAVPGPRTGRIRVALDMTGPEIELRVEDDGMGTGAPGTGEPPAGPGMSVAARIAGRFGGRLEPGPARPSGSEIRIRFPRPNPAGEPPF
jgi:two-component system, sensor histidine kinase PdtaS